MTLMKRKRKKCEKLRGKRRHGHGNIKNRRGAGNRGGRGKAGLHKHKYSYTTKYLREYFGKKGFVNHGPKKKEKIINLYDIEHMVEQGKLKKDDEGMYHLIFDGKVLGCGALSHPIKIKAKSWTEKAKSKVEEVGGTITKISDDQ